MKHFIVGLFLLISFSLPAFAAEEPKESAYDRVMQTGVLRCGYILIPPETIKDLNTGQISGIAYDIATEAARRLGLRIEWSEEVSFQTMTEGLKSSRYDAVCFSLYRYSANAREADFTVPLFYSKTGIFVRADDTRFDGDLAAINNPDVSIAAIDGEMSQFIATDEFPKAKTLSMPQLTDLTQMMLAVETKKADVAFLNGVVAEGYLASNPEKLKDISGNVPLRVFSHGFMFAKKEYDLVRMFDLALLEMHDQGFIQKVLNKYDHEGKTYLRVSKPYENK